MSTTSAPGPSAEPMVRAATAGARAACATVTGEACVPLLRHFVLSCVRRSGMPEHICDTAGLVVSELVTNAVLHSGSSSVAVLIRIGPTDLLIAVRDCGCWRVRSEPRRSSVDDGVSCGRGLALVRALTDFCTVDTGSGGTVVTTRVRLDGPTSAADEVAR